MYVGDFLPGQLVRVPWSTNAKTGASITRSVNGNLVVYRGADTVETTSGVVDIEDFDSVTGIHLTSVDTTAAFYIPHEEYRLVLVGSTVDGEAVSAVVGAFSLLNRSNSFLFKAGTVSGAFTPTTTRFQCADITEASGTHARKTVYCAFGSTLVRQVGVVQTYALTGGRGDITLASPLTTPLVAGDRIVLI